MSKKLEEFKRDDMVERRDEDFFFLLRLEVAAFVFLPFWEVFTLKRTFLRADKYVFEVGNGCSCLMVESLLSFILSNWSSSSSALLLSIMTLSLLISFN